MATFDRLQGTPSCMKIVQLWTCTFSFSFSLSSSTYLGPCMVVLGGTSYRPAAPRLYMAPRSLGSAGVSWSLQHISCENAYLMVARYKLLHGEFDKKQHFLPLNENPMSMTSGKVQSIFFMFFINGVRCGVLAGMWEFSLHSLLIRLETVLEVIAVPFKRKTARIFLQGLFGERLTICLIERSSLAYVSVDDQTFSCYVRSALYLTLALGTAGLEQRNLAAIFHSVYPSPCEVTICSLGTSVKEDVMPIACRDE